MAQVHRAARHEKWIATSGTIVLRAPQSGHRPISGSDQLAVLSGTPARLACTITADVQARYRGCAHLIGCASALVAERMMPLHGGQAAGRSSDRMLYKYS